ncbi:MAG: hypothetical protein AAFW98_17975 [Pseudomonadota bacterium]
MMAIKNEAVAAVLARVDRKKGGRPPYQRDDHTARQVEAMAGYGIPLAQIAKVIEICENTMRKYYLDEIELGAVKANAKVIESLFRKATGDGHGAVTAAIFWAKTRCGWKETTVNEHSHAVFTKEQRDAAVAAALRADT